MSKGWTPQPSVIWAAALWLVGAALQIGGWQSPGLAYALLAAAGACTLWATFTSNWASALHRRYGTRYPVHSLFVVAAIGAVVFGSCWIAIGKFPPRHATDEQPHLVPSDNQTVPLPDKIAHSAQPTAPVPTIEPQRNVPTHPRGPTLKLMFKEAPALTPRMRDKITRDVSDFAYFLSNLDLTVPSATPPIGINTNNEARRTFIQTPHPAFYDDIMLGEKLLGSQDVTAAYSQFVFNQMLVDGRIAITIYPTRSFISNAASTYYNWSFWDSRSGPTQRWADVFWKFRQRLGKRFSDALMAYAIKVTLDDNYPTVLLKPKKNQTLEEVPLTSLQATDNVIDTYMFQKITVANRIVDNLNSNMPVIIEIIKSSPVQVDFLETN